MKLLVMVVTRGMHMLVYAIQAVSISGSPARRTFLYIGIFALLRIEKVESSG